MSRSQLDRYHQLTSLIRQRRGASRVFLQHELGISRATLTRYISELRDIYDYPIRFDRDIGGYVWEDKGYYRGRDLPGVWYSEEQIHALLAMDALIQDLSPELISRTIQPIRDQLSKALESASAKPDELRRRVKLISTSRRKLLGAYFPELASAIVTRRRVRMRYYARIRDQESQREVSPPRLLHHRSNWYLEAWCHRAEGLRNFSVDCIRELNVLETSCREIPLDVLEQQFDAGYGLYSGPETQWAKLRFTVAQSRWARDEIWHPMQRGTVDAEGHWVLEVPFADVQEIQMEVLRFGPSIEVLAPAELRDRVAKTLGDAARQYKIKRLKK